MTDYLPLIIVCSIWLLCWGVGVRMVVWHDIGDYLTPANLGQILVTGLFAPLIVVLGSCVGVAGWLADNSDRPLLRIRPRKRLPEQEPPARGDWS